MNEVKTPADMFTKNKFIDWCLKIVPEDPVTQTLYMYCLTTIVFVGLTGFSIMSWMETFSSFAFSTMFSALFMTAISLMSLFGLKQTRMAYMINKEMRSQPQQEMKVESFDEMIEGFK